MNQVIYTTPGGWCHNIYKDMLKQNHLLIAGTSGSGKSVVINSIMYTALLESPATKQFILIDPKLVELSAYRYLPHTIGYASMPQDMPQALQYALNVINQRYMYMSQIGIKKYDGSDIYVVIDELADLMLTNKRIVQPLLQRISQIGRAASVHLIAATQCPLAKVIPTEIKVNFDGILGLRTRSAQDSRNIIGMAGCEKLPEHGQGWYITPRDAAVYEIPMETEEDIQRLINYWLCYTRQYA